MKLPFLKTPFLKAKTRPPVQDAWQPGPVYPSLFALESLGALRGKGGIYALWHLGVRPRWLWIGASADLPAAFAAAAPRVEAYRANGGVFVTWAVVETARRPGIVRYLRERLKPALKGLDSPDVAEDAAPILFPLPHGTREPTAPS